MEGIERKLLACFMQSKAAWSRIRDKLDDKLFDGALYTKAILGYIDEFYAKDGEASKVDVEVVVALVTSRMDTVKHRDMVVQILKELDVLKVSVENVVELALEIKRKEVGSQLGLAIMNGQASDKQQKLMEEYQSLLDASSLDETEDEQEQYNNLSVSDIIKTTLDKNALIKFLPKSLNDAIDGGALAGHHVTFFARPECFSADTEILTTLGWKPIPDVTESDKVAAVDSDRQVRFEHPKDLVVRDDFEYAYHLHNKKLQLDLIVSPGHRCVYTERGEWKESSAEDLLLYQGRKTHSAAKAGGSREFTARDALEIAYQADGRTRVYKSHGYSGEDYGYEISVFKERKVKRLSFLLDELKVAYSTWKCNKGHTGFYFKLPYHMTKTFDWVELENISKEYAKDFANELMYWDGSARSPTRWKYSNTNKAAVDKAQAIVCLAGYNTFLSEVKDKLGYPTCYELHIRSVYQPVDGGSVVKTKVHNPGPMYCFSVSTGMLLVRRNGKVAISGNCGKTAAMMTMLYGFLLQGLDVIYMGNEDPLLQIIQRAMTCITGMTKDEIANNPDKAENILAKRNWHKARFIPLTPGSIFEIDKYVKRYKPTVCIIDQMRNITSKAGTKAEQLEETAKGIRQIGKKYNCLMITVTQAGDSASGKLVLGMGDISDSNTGIPAQCDVLVGMGLTAEYENQGLRMLATPKNKLSGKHIHWPVKLLTQISRMEDV